MKLSLMGYLPICEQKLQPSEMNRIGRQNSLNNTFGPVWSNRILNNQVTGVTDSIDLQVEELAEMQALISSVMVAESEIWNESTAF